MRTPWWKVKILNSNVTCQTPAVQHWWHILALRPYWLYLTPLLPVIPDILCVVQSMTKTQKCEICSLTSVRGDQRGVTALLTLNLLLYSRVVHINFKVLSNVYRYRCVSADVVYICLCSCPGCFVNTDVTLVYTAEKVWSYSKLNVQSETPCRGWLQRRKYR